MKNLKYVPFLIGVFFVAWSAEARDLVSASNSATNIVKNVGQALSVMGIISGGAIMQIPGAGQFGKGVMVAGFVGAGCAFGAPLFTSLMGQIFGSM